MPATGKSGSPEHKGGAAPRRTAIAIPVGARAAPSIRFLSSAATLNFDRELISRRLFELFASSWSTARNPFDDNTVMVSALARTGTDSRASRIVATRGKEMTRMGALRIQRSLWLRCVVRDSESDPEAS
jgi:hypothetical protein